MRQGQQHRRGRGRNNNQNNNNHRKGQNPLTRSFESNGPDVKVRGTPAHIAEKYQQLARDAQSSGDHVLAENYLQHAEHYSRIILAYREQQVQQAGDMANGSGRHYAQRPEGQESDEMSADDAQLSEEGAEQPSMMRHGGEQPSMEEGRMPRRGDQPRFRGRHDRQEGYDRSDRQRERPQHRERDRERDRDEDSSFGDRRQSSREMNREVSEQSAAPEASSEQAASPTRAERSEGGASRRERYGLSADQPEFLRRPVRRPRRERDPGFAAETTGAPQADETPGE